MHKGAHLTIKINLQENWWHCEGFGYRFDSYIHLYLKLNRILALIHHNININI